MEPPNMEERGERQFQMLADSMPQLAWMAGPDGHIFWYNLRWYDYTGTTFKEMEGWGWQSVHHPDELPNVLQKWQGCIASGQPFDMVFPIKGKDGIFRPFLTRVVPITDEAGRVVRWFGTNTDISAITRAAEVEQLMIAVVQSAEDAILTRSLDGLVRTWNPAAERLLGYTAAEMIGRNVRCLLPADRLDEETALLDQIKQGRSVAHFETQRCTKNGSLVDVSMTISPILGAAGQVVGASKILRDITAQNAAAAHLKKSNERFAIASEAAGIGFWDYDLASNTLQWDDQMYALYGRSRMDGQQPYDLWSNTLHPDDRARGERELQDAIAGIRPFDTEFRILCPSGEIRFIRAAARVRHDAAGNATQIFGLNFDVTERKGILDRLASVNQQLDIALRSSRSFLARVSAVAGVGGWGLDLRSQVVTWTDETNRLHDTPPDYRPSVEDTLAFFTEESRPLIEQALHECITSSKPYDLELEMVSAKGRRFWARVSGIPEVEDGVTVRLVGALQDITQRRQASEKLAEISSLLEMVLESASEISMIATDPELNIKVFNTGAERLLGYAREEIVGQATLSRFHDAGEIRERGEALSALHGRPIVDADVIIDASTWRQPRQWTYVRKDGRRVPVSLVVTPMFAQNATLLGYLGIAHDVTRQNEYEASLREAMSQARKANSAKSEFLANMSHEIRTPLNAVIGLGYLLEQTPLSGDQRQLLGKIQFAGQSLLGLVNDVLDLSKIEAGEMELEREPFQLADMLHSVTQMLAPQALAKNIELLSEAEPALPVWVLGDGSRLRQIFVNLVNNAIKFTEKGRVKLRMLGADRTSDRIRLRCEVNDTGIGIAPEALERLFTPFTQADTSTTRRFGGTGLGLSIARRFVEMMDGQIGVTSEVGVGSSFWFELPLNIVSDTDSWVRSHGSGFRVMIAAAQNGVCESLEAQTRALGWTPRIVSAGQLRQLMAAADRASMPDVFIIGDRLEDMDAPQLIAHLDANGGRSSRAPVLVIAESEQACLQYASLIQSCDLMLTGPVASSTLFNAVNALVSKRYGHEYLLKATKLQETSAQWLAGVRILVVDDSSINLEVARRILEQQGASIDTCADGLAAVEFVRAHGRTLDIILMDVQMPVLDGNTAARRIRDELGFRETPILALTAGALIAERQRCLESGMNDVVTKPFDPQSLILKIRGLVEKSRGAPLPVVFETRSCATAAYDGIPASFNASKVREMFGSNVELFSSLVQRLLAEFTDLALPERVLPEDRDAMQHLKARAHRLSGSAGMIGAQDVARWAGQLETELKNNAAANQIALLSRHLADALATLHDDVQGYLAKTAKRTMPATPLSAALPGNSASDLAQLRELLRNHNLAAFDKFATLAIFLTDHIDQPCMTRLSHAIDALNFDLASRLLEDAFPADPRPVQAQAAAAAG